MKKAWIITMVVVALALFSGMGLAQTKTIVMDGSTTVLPIAQKVAEAYMKEHPGINITVSGGGSGHGIKALIDGTVDIANSSRFLKDKEVEMAIGKKIYPVPFAVAYDCIIPVVHPENPIVNLTLAQLKAIYVGEVKNWKELGGPDAPVVVISRDTSSGTYEVWAERVLKDAKVFPGALLQASSGAVIQSVAKNKNAIGYVGIGYIDKSVKALSVEGVKGTKENVLNGTYPISRPLFMFTKGWPKGEVMNFINYMLHPQKGQKFVEEVKYVPLY